MLDHERGGFDEIAGVDVDRALDAADDRVMDMTADDAVDAPPPGLARKLRLERTDEIDRVLHLELCPRRERPVWQSQRPARGVEMGIEEKGRRIGPVAEVGEPLRMADDDVEFVSMSDKVALAVGRFVDGLARDLDAAEGQAEELAGSGRLCRRGG